MPERAQGIGETSVSERPVNSDAAAGNTTLPPDDWMVINSVGWMPGGKGLLTATMATPPRV
jgi:hypothetical protein